MIKEKAEILNILKTHKRNKNKGIKRLIYMVNAEYDSRHKVHSFEYRPYFGKEIIWYGLTNKYS